MNPQPFAEDQDKPDWEKMLAWIPLAASLVGLAICAMYYNQLPDRIPMHFDLHGNPDNWSGKFGIFVPSFIGLGIFALFQVIIRAVPPSAWNYPVKITPENAGRQQTYARRLLLALNSVVNVSLALISWHLVKNSINGTFHLSNILMFVLLGGVFGTLAIYFYYALRDKTPD